MSELSHEARAALERGLELDGPSPERRARVRARLLLALGSGTAVLGGAAAPAEAASRAVAGAAAASAKGLGVGSLLVWFGAGALAGGGVTGAVVAARQVGWSATFSTSTSPSGRSLLPPPVVTTAPAPPVRSGTGAPASVGMPPARASESAPTGARPASVGLGYATSSGGAPLTNARPEASAAPVASSSTLAEEAALLQRAERALAGNEPTSALALLAEHERRFPAGALREERQAAKVLALCELGRVADARALARAFLSAAPGSVLVPRLERSCAGPVPRER